LRPESSPTHSRTNKPPSIITEPRRRTTFNGDSADRIEEEEEEEDDADDADDAADDADADLEQDEVEESDGAEFAMVKEGEGEE